MVSSEIQFTATKNTKLSLEPLSHIDQIKNQKIFW